MNYKHLFYLFIFFILILFNFLYSKEAMNIAVLDIEGIGISSNEATVFTDKIISELVSFNKSKFQSNNIIDRSEIEEILKEQAFQQTGCTSEECAIEVGKILGVSHILIGRISKMNNQFSINLKLIEVSTSKITNSYNEDFNGTIHKNKVQLIVNNLMSDTDELFEKGLNLYKRNEYQKAISVFTSILKSHTNFLVLKYRGLSYSEIAYYHSIQFGRNDDSTSHYVELALNDLNKYLLNEINDFPTYTRVGRLYLILGKMHLDKIKESQNLNLAKKYANIVIKNSNSDNDKLEAHYLLSNIYEESNEEKMQKKKLHHIIDTYSDKFVIKGRIYRELATIYYHKEMYDTASFYFEKALTDSTNQLWILHKLIDSYTHNLEYSKINSTLIKTRDLLNSIDMKYEHIFLLAQISINISSNLYNKINDSVEEKKRLLNFTKQFYKTLGLPGISLLIANLYNSLGQSDSSLVFIEESLKYNDKDFNSCHASIRNQAIALRKDIQFRDNNLDKTK